MRVAFACNDYRNGVFQGWCDEIRVDGIELEGPQIRIREVSPTALRVGRCKYKICGGADWVGNWCWNEYHFAPGEWVRLVKNLRSRGWRCNAGPAKFFEAFNKARQE